MDEQTTGQAARYLGDDGFTSPDREATPYESARDALGAEMVGLDDAISRLRSRLEPVLRQQPPSPEPAQVGILRDSAESPLVGQVRDFASAVRMQRNRVEELLDRLDV